MSAIIVIPARHASSRFPGKMLAPLRGATGTPKTLIERSWEAAQAVQGIDSCLVATDDARIAAEVERFGGRAVMTPADCANGKGCTSAADCQSGYCSAGLCQTQPTTTEPCSPAIVKTGGNTGNFETTGAVCYKVSSNIAGWGCSNMTGRTLLVNDQAVTCGGTLPAKVNGAYYFEVSAGEYPWASIYWW